LGGGGGGGRSRGGAQRGSDLRYDMQISFEEAAFGTEKEIQVTKLDACSTCSGSGSESGSGLKSCGSCHGRGQVTVSKGFFTISQTCPTCQGMGQMVEKPCAGRAEASSTIKLKVPAGIEDGMRLRSRGNGEAGIRGGESGDLHVVVHIKEHEFLVRDGDDVHCEVPIPFTIAALGGDVEVPTLDGHASLKVPTGTQGGKMFRLKGKGIKNVQGHGQGDEIVRVIVEIPTKLNAKQKELLEEFAKISGQDSYPSNKSFFERAKTFFKR